MKFAICNELFEPNSLDQVFRQIAETGYQGVEIAPFTLASDPLSIPPHRRREIRQLIATAGLQCVGLHWLLAKTTGLHLIEQDLQIRQRTLAYLIGLTQLCHDLEGNLMVLGSPTCRNLSPNCDAETGFRRAVEILQDLAPELEKRDVTLAIEPLGPEETNFINTAQQGIELSTAVGSSHVKLHLDVKAMSTEDREIGEIIRTSRDWLVHFHANDPNRRGPGTGNVDFQPIVSALQEIDYQGWVSVEVFDFSEGPTAIATNSFDFLQQAWQRAD